MQLYASLNELNGVGLRGISPNKSKVVKLLQDLFFVLILVRFKFLCFFFLLVHYANLKYNFRI